MAVLRSSGGAGRAFKLTWQGATVERQIVAGAQKAMDDEAKEIAADLRESLHRWPAHKTHPMADESFAVVSVAGTKRTLRLGSDAPYSIYEEEGTSQRAGHHVIRTVANRAIPRITPRLRQALRGGR